MIYDCFLFFNEVDILKLRLHVMEACVDRFVIGEAEETFSGVKKELIFDRYREAFQPFLDKITYVRIGCSPAELTPHERDRFQKNQLIKGLPELSEEDIIVFSDLDEIPEPHALQRVLDDFDREKIYHFAQRNFYVFLNVEEVGGNLISMSGEFAGIEKEDRRILGTKVFAKESIPQEGIGRIRDVIDLSDPRNIRVAEGGWHFGYMGGSREKDVMRRIGTKLRAAAHQEYNDAEILKETMDHLFLGEDIFGRDARYQQVEIDESFPAYLREHLKEYDHLILAPITPLQRVFARLDLTAGRFFRKAVRKVKRMTGGRA